MINEFFDCVYVISMASSPRRQKIVDHLGGQGIKHVVVDGVDGRHIDLAAMIAKGEHVVKGDRPMNAVEVAVVLSHLKVWKEAFNKRHKKILVLEDDARLVPGAADVLSHVPPNWDILHLHSKLPLKSGVGRDQWRVPVRPHIWRGYNECGGALALGLRHTAYAYLIDNVFPIQHPIDGLTNWPTSPWNAGLAMHGYVTDPFVFGHSGDPSEVGDRPSWRTLPPSFTADPEMAIRWAPAMRAIPAAWWVGVSRALFVGDNEAHGLHEAMPRLPKECRVEMAYYNCLGGWSQVDVFMRNLSSIKGDRDIPVFKNSMPAGPHDLVVIDAVTVDDNLPMILRQVAKSATKDTIIIVDRHPPQKIKADGLAAIHRSPFMSVWRLA